MISTQPFQISGRLVDIENRRIFPAVISVNNGKISSIMPIDHAENDFFILPGFIDAHIHIESSLLIPSEFARIVTVHGTVATISDPHEIANVLGLQGVRYMIENGKQVPFHFFFGAPSCVPATSFETSGAIINAKDIESLFKKEGLHYLSEMMNFPGILNKDPIVMDKIAIAKNLHKPIDGHAPGLRGIKAQQYIQSGITTDHECTSLEEALDKLNDGMKILIREGSAARNYEALHPLIQSHPRSVMFCSDDKHPHELVEGHINLLVKRSIIEKKYDLMDVLYAACLAPIKHYNLPIGNLKPGDSADFIIVDNLHDFQIKETYIKGQLTAKSGKPLIPHIAASIINHFNCRPKQIEEFEISASPGNLRVIEAVNGQLMTYQKIMKPCIEMNKFVSDPSRDLLKIVVINRYQEAPIAMGFIHKFGLKHGALASSIAHDSHNIICVGVSDQEICQSVNAIIAHQGGIAVTANGVTKVLPLPVGGIMSAEDGYKIAHEYQEMDRLAKKLGTKLDAPFITLSFMALLVIPSLKLSDKGLFDGDRFTFVPLVTE